ncbi:MAG TPA: alkaline phosphatase family protein [Verrucomicrobiae bacterium]|nr:alkaline phosphatase family protein [Verrucomicrobiae bacterium]
MRALLALACLLASAVSAAAGAPLSHAHVYLVVVDGLDARFGDAAHLPRLYDAVAHEPAHSSVFPGAHAVMPARTNPNHVTLLTGAYAEAHGITGNAYWSRTPGAPPERLEDAARIEVETLFTVVETTAPSRVTLGVVGKPKLARLFAGVPGRQRAPDVLWSPERLPAARREAGSGYSPDDETIGAALALAAEAEPDLAVVNLSDVDSAGHAHGPESAEYARAVGDADAAIARLLDDLHARGRWDRSVVFVTADHGMSAVGPTPERPQPAISLGAALREAGVGGDLLVGDGGVEHVYAERVTASATAAGDAAETLARVAALARAVPGVVEVLARLPVPGLPTLRAAHPDWHLDHPRTGELLLVAAPGYQFVDPFDPGEASLRGNHGGPENLAVPLVVTGGWPGLRAAPRATPPPGAVDVAPTIAVLLGVRAPRLLDGHPVPPGRAGHPIAALLAQSPH